MISDLRCAELQFGEPAGVHHVYSALLTHTGGGESSFRFHQDNNWGPSPN